MLHVLHLKVDMGEWGVGRFTYILFDAKQLASGKCISKIDPA